MSLRLISAGLALGLAFGAQQSFAADPKGLTPQKGLVWSGDVTAYGGANSLDDPDGELDTTGVGIFGGGMRFSVPVANRVSLQFDVLGEGNTDTDLEGSVRIFGAGAHINMRNPSRGLIGLFGGLGSVEADQDDTADVLWGGAEGQLYINMLTLYGQIGAVDSNNSHDSLDFSHLFARGVLRYYVKPNWVIEGEASYTQGIIHSDTMDAIGWGAKTKFGLGKSPFVAGLEYRGTHYDGHGEGSATEHAGLVSLSLVFGQAKTLFDMERFGAGVDTPTLPMRAAVWTSPLD